MNPCKSLYQKTRYILNFEDDLSSTLLDEFNKLFAAPKNIQKELQSSLKQSIDRLCQFIETIDDINPNYFNRLTYLLNIDFIEELKNVAHIMNPDNHMINAILVTYDDFKNKYAFSNNIDDVLNHPSIGVDVLISLETVKQFKEMLYDIYLHMFYSRTIKKLFVVLTLNDKKLSIKFSDTFITQLSTPEWFPKFIDLNEYKIKFTEDNRLTRNKNLQIELERKIDEMERKILTVKNNKKTYAAEIATISKESDDPDIKLLKIINLLEKTENASSVDINEITEKIKEYKNKIFVLAASHLSNSSFY